MRHYWATLSLPQNTILNKVFKYRNFILCAVLAIGCLLVGESFIINQIALREVNNLLIFSIPLALVVVSVSLSLKIVHL